MAVKKTAEGLKVKGNDIYIFGIIGLEIDSQDVIDNLPPSNQPVKVFINSFGGSYVEALTIYNVLNLRKGKVTTIAVGSVGSAATVVYAAGDERLSSQQAVFMYHQSKIDPGNISLDQMKSLSKFMGDAEDSIRQIYIKGSNNQLSLEQVNELLENGDTFLTPQQAMEKGLVTHILGDGEKLNLSASVYQSLAANFGINLVSEEKPMDEELKQYLISLKLDPEDVEKDEKLLSGMKLAFDAHKLKTKTPPPLPKKDKDRPTDPTLEYRERVAVEEERIDSIRLLFKKPDFSDIEKVTLEDGKEIQLSSFKSKVIKDDKFSPEKVELVLLRSARPDSPAVHVKDSMVEDTNSNALTISLLRSVGVPSNEPIPTCNQYVKVPSRYSDKPNYGLEHWYKEADLEKADEYRRTNGGEITLHTLYGLYLQQAGMSMRRGTGTAETFVNRAKEAYRKLSMAGEFSAMGAGNILEDTTNKMLLAAYQAQAVTWPSLASIKSFNDFKQHKFYRLDINGMYQAVGKAGELKHGHMSDAKFTADIDTYGLIMGLTRKDRINDDLDAFSTLVQGMGKKANLANESLFYEAFLGNIANWTSPSSELALALSAIDTLRQVFSSQTNDGDPIMVTPRIIVTGGTLAFTAEQIFGQPTFLPSGEDAALDISQIGIKNPHYNRYTPVTSEYVDNTSVTNATNGAAISGQTTTGYGIMASPSDLAAVYMGFLNGNQNPTVEQQNAPFETLGDQFRMYHDVGTGLGDTKAVVWSDGDA